MPSSTAAKSAPTANPGQSTKDHSGGKKESQAVVALDAEFEPEPAALPVGVEDESADPVGPVGGRQARTRGAQAAPQRAQRAAR